MPPKTQPQQPQQQHVQKVLRSGTTAASPAAKKTVIDSPVVQKDDSRVITDKIAATDGAAGLNDSRTGIHETEVEPVSIRDEIKKLFEKMDDKMSRKFTELDTKFTKMFENFKEEIHAVRIDVEDTKKELKLANEKIEGIEKSLEFHAQAQKDLEKSQEEKLNLAQFQLEKKIRDLDSKLMLLEKQDRKYNLLIYGVKEREKENIYDTIRDLFIEALGMDEEKVQNMYFAHAHRLPSSENNEGPTPIIVRFTSFEERDMILSAAPKLAGSKRRIVSDLPVPMKKERARLAKAAYRIRKEENLQTRIKDKGLDVFLEVRKDELHKWSKRIV